MALTTYVELQAAIRTEINVTTSGITDAAIVDAINRAEAKINRRARFREMEQLAYATYSSGSRYLAVPDGITEVLNLRIKKATEADIKYEEVVFVAPAGLWEFYETPSDNDRFYYTLRDQIEFNREVSEDHTVMMHYIKSWDIASTSTSWLLTHYPDVYLYGALMECEMHLRQDERVPMWKSLFDEAILELNSLDERGRDDSQLDTSEVTRMARKSTYNILTG
jgi:hypothetical protein